MGSRYTSRSLRWRRNAGRWEALKWGMAQGLITKNPCDSCKPPKRARTPINALSREEHTRMLELARRAQPAPLGIAIELALTTGMGRGEVCALRWSDLSDDGTITVSRALGNGDGGFYVKEPWTSTPTLTRRPSAPPWTRSRRASTPR